MYLIFDTETTGLPKRWNAPITDIDNWPRCVQIAWQLHDQWGKVIESRDYLIKPDGFDIPYDAERIHGISTALAEEQGEDLIFVLKEFNEALHKSTFVVGQNVGFDVNIMGCEFYSHSIVLGGLLDISKTTLLIPFTELIISEEIRSKTS